MSDPIETIEQFIIDKELPVRICTGCSKLMTKGYCIESGASYYCDKDCLEENLPQHEIDALDIGADDSNSYWTEWE